MRAFVELRDNVREILEQVKIKKQGNVLQSNAMVGGRVGNTRQVLPIQMVPLKILDTKLNGLKVRVLKDDGFDTNVVPKRIAKNFRHCFKVAEYDVLVQHSNKDSDEQKNFAIS